MVEHIEIFFIMLKIAVVHIKGKNIKTLFFGPVYPVFIGRVQLGKII